MQRKKFEQTPPYSALLTFDFSLFSSGCGFFRNLLGGRVIDKPFATAIITSDPGGSAIAGGRENRRTEMNMVIKAVGGVAIYATLSPSLFAQWPPYPASIVPRTPGGEPNLAAPAPKTANGTRFAMMQIHRNSKGVRHDDYLCYRRQHAPGPVF